MNHKTKIVILGGGFAGIKALHELHKNKNLEITLITDQETFRYGATIWRAATGYLKDTSYIPIKSLMPVSENVRLVLDQAVRIDRESKLVTTKSHEKFNYDYCIIGLGVVTSYFGIDGLEEFSYSVKSSAGFDKFRQHLHDLLLEDKTLDTNYVVVGAGPTGVELAAALKSYLKTVAKQHKLKRTHVNMDLIEAAPKVLPMLSPKASKLVHKRLVKLGVRVMTGKVVEGETTTTLKVGDMKIPTKTVIWTAGVTNNPFFNDNNSQFTLNEKKRVVVDDYLKVDKSVFVIGDSAATAYSGLALTALHNANYVSNCILKELDKKSVRPYKPLKPITIIPIGEGWSLLQWRKIVFAGRFASFLRSIYDFIGYSEIVGSKKAFNIWLKRNQKHEECRLCRS